MPNLAPLVLLLAGLTAARLAYAQRPTPDTVGGLPRRAVLGVAIAADSSAPDGRVVV